MPPSLPQFSAARARSYIFRLPLFTRCIILVIVLLWLVSLQSAWDVQQWGALIPKEIGLATSSSSFSSLKLQDLLRIENGWLMETVCVVYRTNTFPLVHANFFHAFMNILALTPLLERFEAEYGTLTTLALFLGRMYSPFAWNGSSLVAER
jgi:GPI-anchor transamidase subunit GAA1